MEIEEGAETVGAGSQAGLGCRGPETQSGQREAEAGDVKRVGLRGQVRQVSPTPFPHSNSGSAPGLWERAPSLCPGAAPLHLPP